MGRPSEQERRVVAGQPPTPGPRVRGVCSIEGCSNPHKARGWCKSHYGLERAKAEPEYAARRAAIKLENRRRRDNRRRAESEAYQALRDAGQLP